MGLTYSDGIGAVGNSLSSEFDVERVLPNILYRIVNAERSITIVFDVNVHITRFDHISIISYIFNRNQMVQ